MKFKSKPWKTGHSHVITVPKTAIESGEISPEKEYSVELNEVQNE